MANRNWGNGPRGHKFESIFWGRRMGQSPTLVPIDEIFQVSNTGEIEVVMLDATAHKELAISLFNQTWDLLEKSGRIADEDFLMIHKAHASLFHWLQVGTALNEARGQWQISRVYATLKWAQPALNHGKRSLQICLDERFGDFDLAFGYESVARAYSILGNQEEAKNYLLLGRRAAELIKKPEDKRHFMENLESIQA